LLFFAAVVGLFFFAAVVGLFFFAGVVGLIYVAAVVSMIFCDCSRLYFFKCLETFCLPLSFIFQNSNFLDSK